MDAKKLAWGEVSYMRRQADKIGWQKFSSSYFLFQLFISCQMFVETLIRMLENVKCKLLISSRFTRSRLISHGTSKYSARSFCDTKMKLKISGGLLLVEVNGP